MTAALAAETTRARLLRAAGALLLERGFAGTTTRSISERAGVNNALVHYHFGSKSQLLAEAALGVLGDDMARPAELLREASSLSAGIEAVLRWIGELDLADPSVRVLMELTVEAFRDERVRPVVAAALQVGREDTAGALAGRDDVDGSDADALGAILAALFDGVFLHRMVDGGLDVSRWASAAGAIAPPRRRSRR